MLPETISPETSTIPINIFPPLMCPHLSGSLITAGTCLETKCGQWDIKTSQCSRLATLETLRSIANSLSNIAKNSWRSK